MAFVRIDDIDEGAPIGYIFINGDRIGELNQMLRDRDLCAYEVEAMFLGDFGDDVESAFRKVVE